ncbi:MAG: electron transfer flavoprotein subunit alpha/FixB family protein [Bacteroidales bacterium]|nr:electron transfer flavoprotein subunit alpha/FixB family protein [Bacteroidales bacterium]
MSVLIYTENKNGRFKKQSFELSSYARAIADLLSVKLYAVTFGSIAEDEIKAIGDYGVDQVFHISGVAYETFDNQIYSMGIEKVATEVNAAVVIFAHDNSGKALAPRLSAKLTAGLVSAVIGLPESIEPFIIGKKVFSGKALARVRVKTDRKVLTLSPNAFAAQQKDNNIQITAFDLQLDEALLSVKVEESFKQEGKILLTEADIVVSAGRGMKSADNWGNIEAFAEILGAATACSRPVSDEGWRPHAEHVGQTGKVIAPNLYFAFGISGAIQHIAGVSSSKVIVAVNKDPEAPVFETADYGIVGDVNKVLPQLIEAAKELNS